ncbi:MAG TPA: ATP-binding protein [Solirubrobacteraceae bacterium]|nr:ATP-binding protein [Solirubrobacteraceae bacterium]
MSHSEPRSEGRPRAGRGTAPNLRVGQWLAFTIGGLLLLAVVGIALALAANARLSDRRKLLVDGIGPAQLAALNLENALVNQETGVRGYALTRQPRFLEPYRAGLLAETQAYRDLAPVLGGPGAPSSSDVAAVRADAQAWQHSYVAPVLHGARSTAALDSLGKARFDAIRTSLAALQSTLVTRRAQARDDLYTAGRVLTVNLIVAGALIILGLLVAGLVLRRTVTGPLARLGHEARRVARGDFETPLAELGGAREIVEARVDVDEMRELIVRELAAVRAAQSRLERQAVELQRSNDELEQFAYVASHDLQEPLRKVTSFCQALQQRYEGRLDERADQYIHFAVDGAKRMQILINDLLAFSRVGRSERAYERVPAAGLVAQAESSLSEALAETGATVTVSELPTVYGDRALLASVFQNLIANAVKFHDADPPVIRIEARRDGDRWEFSCTDNGIGIDPEYAERIFVIFQRLHAKESYPGTGIGLAMCRKIIERHGGRIWVDTAHSDGTRIRFTLPITEESQT